MHLSSELKQQIHNKIQDYGSEEAVLIAALQALEEKEQLHYEREAVLEGLQQLKNGQSTSYTRETLGNLFEKIKTEGKQKLSVERTR